MSEQTITVTLAQQKDYQFEIHFNGVTATVLGDEPPPLGASQGPSPVHLLCAAVGNCLSDSLLFALRKFKQSPDPMRCAVQAQVGRNAEGRIRVLEMTASLHLGVQAAQLEHLDRVLEQFENYCTVTQSVRQGIPIHTIVYDSTGACLKSSDLPSPASSIV